MILKREPRSAKRRPFASALCAMVMSVLALSIAAFPNLTLAADALQAKKPNILILWGDDIGYWNISAYNQGHDGI